VADLSQFVRYLDRPDVSELVLQTERPACIRRGGQMVPLTKAALRHEHLVAIITRPPMARPVPSSDTSGNSETLTIGGQSYEVRIARRGDALQIRITSGASTPAAATNEAGAHDSGALDPAQLSGQSPPLRAASPRPTPAPASPAPSRAQAPSTSTGAPPTAAPATPPPAATGAPTPVMPSSSWVNEPADTGLAKLLGGARRHHASDVILVSGRPALIRVFNQLRPTGPELDDARVRQMLHSVLSERDRTQLEQLGYCDFALEVEGAGRLRVNVARQRTGLKGTFRLVRSEPPTIENLGLPHALTKITRYHQGMIVISGPNGHGKTTTMAGMVNLLNRQKPDHIITVEDPVEVIHPRAKAVITQRQVGTHTASFEAALKGALREDPDVIVIGELRDRETVEMALSAAETGHLVLATMSTPSGAKTIDRLIDMFPPDDQSQVRATLAGALKMVISQRLVALADGSGLTVAVELITGNVALWNLIRDNKLFQLPSLLQRGSAYGMLRLEESLKLLVDNGKVTREEAMRWANDPRSFQGSAAGASGGPDTAAPDQPPPDDGPSSGIAGGLRNLFGKKGS